MVNEPEKGGKGEGRDQDNDRRGMTEIESTEPGVGGGMEGLGKGEEDGEK